MGRVSQIKLDKLREFIDSLPEEARQKCSLCNETLTHIVKQAEAQTGLGTETVTRELALVRNVSAKPNDQVSAVALRDRVKRTSGDKSIQADHLNSSIQSRAHLVTDALYCATLAISQLDRIRLDDPKREEAFDEVVEWITQNRRKPKGRR